MITQSSGITSATSLYPKSKMFKPARHITSSVYHLAKHFHDILATPAEHTREELAYRARFKGYPNIPSYVSDSFDDDTTKDWVQKGPHWVRVVEGPYPHCWTMSRVNATAWWRNAPDSYCCAGFPYFEQKHIEKFRREMELVKPIVWARINNRIVTLCLERTLEGPIGNCWGIRTADTFFRVEVDGVAQTIPNTKAALKRTLDAIS